MISDSESRPRTGYGFLPPHVPDFPPVNAKMWEWGVDEALQVSSWLAIRMQLGNVPGSHNLDTTASTRAGPQQWRFPQELTRVTELLPRWFSTLLQSDIPRDQALIAYSYSATPLIRFLGSWFYCCPPFTWKRNGNGNSKANQILSQNIVDAQFAFGRK